MDWLQMQQRFLSKEFVHQLLDYETFTHGINFVDMGVAMLLATILGAMTAKTYRKVQYGVNYSRNFEVSIVLIAVVVTMIMAVVGSNIARAFSLVGALSIVRFRTAVRSGLDITFIFFAVAIGLCLGSRFYVTALFSSFWFCGLSIGLKLWSERSSKTSRCVILKSNLKQDPNDLNSLKDAFNQKGGMCEVLSYDPNRDGEGGQLSLVLYDLSLEDVNGVAREHENIDNYKIVFNESTVAF
jgi:uncharacterized membrane protein YhiD involved in acid resistance